MLKIMGVLVYIVAILFNSCENEHNSASTTKSTDFIRYRTDLTMHSSILGESIKYAIYLPSDYNNSLGKTYSVVYLLHGYGCDHNDWNDEYLNVTSLINRMELDGGISEMIYVMPQGFNSYYVNVYDGSYDYMDMFVKELVPFIDKTYFTKDDRKNRAIVGFSMGGYGAMVLPSKHPNLFSISVPLSMSFRTDEQYINELANGWDSQWGAIFGGIGLSDEARLTDYYKAHCPFYYFNAQTASNFAEVDFFIDCGDDEEQLLVGNDLLHRQLRDLGIAHEYRVSDGAHTSSYWREAMHEVLSYIDCRFRGDVYPKEENVDTEEAFAGVLINEEVESVPVVVFKSAGFDASSVNTAIYFIHDGWSQTDVNKTMNLLNLSSAKKRFIVVSIEQHAIGKKLPIIAKNIRAKYNITHHMGLGVGRGGKVLYEASIRQNPIISSLFLFDALIDEKDMLPPNSETFYYIDIPDMGLNYDSAGELYLLCMKNKIEHEYRVRNGINSIASQMKGIFLAEPSILSCINDL